MPVNSYSKNGIVITYYNTVDKIIYNGFLIPLVVYVAFQNVAHPFDSYSGQPIVCFDEFDSSFKLTDFLNFIDIYPLWLPCRYNDKVACYETVYIISNKPLTDQYKNIQTDNKEQYNALLRRIHNIIKIEKDGKQTYEKQDGKDIQKMELMPIQ
jgi:hypothetical protein